MQKKLNKIAEDTNIFENDIFTNGISSHTQSDGSDLNEYFDRLFEVLNTDDNNRTNLPDYLSVFPYVNGGLFKDSYKAPKFTKHSRQIIIECGTLDWAEINPDIFGSMMQGVVSFEDRGNVGMHYTSVENIMKLIKPLFLDELYEEFDSAKGNDDKLIGKTDLKTTSKFARLLLFNTCNVASENRGSCLVPLVMFS